MALILSIVGWKGGVQKNTCATTSVHSSQGKLAENLYTYRGTFKATNSFQFDIAKGWIAGNCHKDIVLATVVLCFSGEKKRLHLKHFFKKGNLRCLVTISYLQSSKDTQDIGAIQKGADFVQAFILGFEVEVRVVEEKYTGFTLKGALGLIFMVSKLAFLTLINNNYWWRNHRKNFRVPGRNWSHNLRSVSRML